MADEDRYDDNTKAWSIVSVGAGHVQVRIPVGTPRLVKRRRCVNLTNPFVLREPLYTLQGHSSNINDDAHLHSPFARPAIVVALATLADRAFDQCDPVTQVRILLLRRLPLAIEGVRR